MDRLQTWESVNHKEDTEDANEIWEFFYGHTELNRKLGWGDRLLEFKQKLEQRGEDLDTWLDSRFSHVCTLSSDEDIQQEAHLLMTASLLFDSFDNDVQLTDFGYELATTLPRELIKPVFKRIHGFLGDTDPKDLGFYINDYRERNGLCQNQEGHDPESAIVPMAIGEAG